MGLKQVKSEILDEAEEEAEEIIDEANKKSEEIIEEAEDEAESIRQRFETELDEEKQKYEQRTVSNARMKAKQIELSAKQEKIDEVFEGFKEELSDMSDDQKANYVDRCIDKVEFEPGKVLGSEEFEQHVDIDFEQRDIEGIVVVSEKGEKRQDFSFKKITEGLKNRYRGKVAEELFSE